MSAATASGIRWDRVATARIPARRWREALAFVRDAMRAAEKLRGRDRRDQLVRACRLLVAHDPPGWHTRRDGVGYRVETTDTRAYDRAERRIERQIAALVDDCVGCFAMRVLPEDRAARGRKRRVSSRSRSAP